MARNWRRAFDIFVDGRIEEYHESIFSLTDAYVRGMDRLEGVDSVLYFEAGVVLVLYQGRVICYVREP